MPHYFFNISDRPDLPDLDGLDLVDMAAVRVAAVRTCGEILCDYSEKAWRTLDWTMVVSDEAGVTVLTPSFHGEEPKPEAVQSLER